MTEKTSILIVQSNPQVGNIDKNKQIVIDHIESNKSDLIIFSELMLTGYPPEDLVLKPAFMEKVNNAISDILNCSKNSNSTIIIGTPFLEESKLFNTALVIKKGKILHKHHKMALPNYGVFDEKRIFSNGEKVSIIEFNGIKLGLFICEDIWVNDTIVEIDKKRYQQMLKQDQLKMIAGRSVNEILERFNNKIKDPRRAKKGKNVAKIIKDFLKIKCSIDQAANKLNYFFKKNKINLRVENNYFPITKNKVSKLNIRYSASFGRQLEYYTGLVFKIEIKKKSKNINIINGGRYDNLIGDLGSNKKIPAVGAAINLND